jgi:GT2 family glycosyltransferase
MDLTIVIVNWNTRDFLVACLRSLFLHTQGLSFEVYVVDNASADGSADCVASSFPQVHLIANRSNLGFSRANNQALRVAQGEFVALLNPDTSLIENVFLPLVQEMRSRPEVGAAGPMILNGDGRTVQVSCARRLPRLLFNFCDMTGLARRFPRSRLFGAEYMSFWDHGDSRYVEALSGACMVVRKKAIDSVGLLDESQFMYCDDIDWCLRFLAGGWKIYYVAPARVIHFGGEGIKQALLEMNLQVMKAQDHYYRKHNGSVYAWCFCGLVFSVSTCKYIWRRIVMRGGDRRLLLQDDKNLAAWALRKLFGVPG